MIDDYLAFLETKVVRAQPTGLTAIPALNPALFPHQRYGVEFALRAGRAALFYDTGLGKTIMQLEWARVVAEHTGGKVLILAPLAVAAQTVREGKRFGIDVAHARQAADVGSAITIANYERLHLFNPADVVGVVLDESSILKSFMGKTKRTLCEAFSSTPFRLACTATPAPNDHMELGNHAEFLGVMNRLEMLSRWFRNDTATASQSWSLKPHGADDFWRWVASWAACAATPSDLGFDDGGFLLPELKLVRHKIEADLSVDTNGALFRIPEMSATSLHREKQLTVTDRAQRIADLVNADPDYWIVWCDTNYEADAIKAMVPDAIEVRGNETAEVKERKLEQFSTGNARVIISKPSLAGYGLNWQHCANVAFVGVSFSYESFYQAIRRSWRYGQKRPVNVHVAVATTEDAIWKTLARKQSDHDEMKSEMFAAANRERSLSRNTKVPYQPRAKAVLPAWLAA